MSAPRVVISRRASLRITDPVIEAWRCVVCSKRLDSTGHPSRKYCGNTCYHRALRLKKRGLTPSGQWVNAKHNTRSKYSKRTAS